jgi:hypothetical protein
MKILRTIITSIIVSQLLFTAHVFAEISATLSLDPIHPEPKSTVDIIMESYSFDVNTAMITWKIGGKVVLSGLGEKILKVKTGDVGTTVQVNVVASTANGSSIEQQIDVTPSSVLLLYEAPYSYIPTFYQGLSLPSKGGLVKVSALPQISDNGTQVAPSSLAYTWSLNDGILRSMSGTGKQSALIKLDYLKSKNEIKVVARSPLGNTGTKTITIASHPIMPLFYLYDPLFGVDFNNVITRRFETTSNFNLALEPFYVSQEEKGPAFNWFLNGLPSTPINGKILGFQPQENSYGSKMLNIKITGPDKRIQNTETKLEILFDTRK